MNDCNKPEFSKITETTVIIGEDLLVAGGRSKKHMDELLEKIPISFMERANYSFFSTNVY